MSLTFFGRVRTHSWCIRAQQIAQRLGPPVKLSPYPLDFKSVENDTCIYVRTVLPGIPKCKKMIFDIVDAYGMIRTLKRHEDFDVIAISPIGEEYLKNILKNKVHLIPQHHCNFNRFIRPDRPIKKVGFCGLYETFALYENEIREKLRKIGLELDFYHTYRQGSNVKDWYKNIDIQIIWRTPFEEEFIHFKNPLKITNANSFGIPTVAKPEDSFISEYNGYFLPAYSIDDLISNVEDLKNDTILYKELSDKIIVKSEEYHIDNIIKLYKNLEVK